PLTKPRWASGLQKVPQYRLELAGALPYQPSASELRAAAIRKVMAYSYSEAQRTSEGRQLLAGLTSDVRQDLESSAKEYPQISQGEAAEARNQATQGGFSFFGDPTVIFRATPFMIIVLGAFAGLCSVVLAAIFRTGPLLRAFNLSLQSRDGKRPARLQCS